MDIHEDLMFPALAAADRDDVLATLGQAVIERGFARTDYVTALLEREGEYPTGLPISGGVAIPHTAAEYVTTDTIVAATLATPVTFAEMGGDATSEVPVSTVLLLVLADSSKHVSVLSRLIKGLQKADLVESLHQASDQKAMASVIAGLVSR